MKIRPVGAELFHEDGRTDMTKLTVAFRSFVKYSNLAKNAVKQYCLDWPKHVGNNFKTALLRLYYFV